MNPMQTNASTELAKDYISKRKIPQLFEALITGLMVHKPENHVEFIIESLTRYKDGNQQVKWDAFIGRKGGMKNTLAPLKTSTDTNDTGPQTELSRAPKLDAIPHGKREASKIEDRPQSPVPGQQRERQMEHHADSIRQDHHAHSPTLDHQEQKVDHQVQSPTPHHPHPHHVQSPTPDEHLERKEEHHAQSPIPDQHEGQTEEHHAQSPTPDEHLERKEEHQTHSPISDQHQERTEEHHAQSPTPHHKQEEQNVDDHPPSPTVTHEHQNKDEDTKSKDLLKGKPIIFVGGGPGSGKGTQCEKMIEKYGFTHLSAGDLIRAASEDSSTEKGRYFNEAMSQGKLVSTEDILGLLKDAIYEKANEASGFLIDGFPRRIDQGIQFEQEVAPCDVLIYFDVPDEVMTERLIKRGETSGRIDDNEETIAKRLVTFHEQTTPILGYYGKQGKLVTIDAHREADEVFADVSQTLEGLMEQHQVGKQ